MGVIVKTLKGFTIAITLLAVTAAMLAFSMDSKWNVEVSESISASKQEIFPYINTLKKWPEWTAWNQGNHPSLKMSYEGPESGPGAIQIWNDKDESGKLEIIKSEPDQLLEYQLNMGNSLFLINGQILLSESQNGTVVTWKQWGDNGSNLFGRLLVLAFKPTIKKDLTDGLRNLKQLLGNKS